MIHITFMGIVSVFGIIDWYEYYLGDGPTKMFTNVITFEM